MKMKHYIAALQPDKTLDHHAIQDEEDTNHVVCFNDEDEAEAYRSQFPSLKDMLVFSFVETSEHARHENEMEFASCDEAKRFGTMCWVRRQQKEFGG